MNLSFDDHETVKSFLDRPQTSSDHNTLQQKEDSIDMPAEVAAGA